MSRQRAECGTEKAYWQHVYHGEPRDQLCREAHADHVRSKRPAKEPKEPAPCGTLAAYARHMRRKEPVDEKCRAKRTEANRIGREADRLAARIFGTEPDQESP